MRRTSSHGIKYINWCMSTCKRKKISENDNVYLEVIDETSIVE